MLYYWDDRDGSDFSGWWFGPRVGGDQASKFGRVQCHCIGTRTRVIFVNRYVLYVSLFNRYCSTICISTMHLYACIFCPYPSAPQSTNPSNQWLPLRCGQVWGYQPSTDTTPPESGWKVLQLKCTDVNDVEWFESAFEWHQKRCKCMCIDALISGDSSLGGTIWWTCGWEFESDSKERKERERSERRGSSKLKLKSSAYVVSAVSCRHILCALAKAAAAYPQMPGMPGMPGWYGMYYGMQPSSDDPHAAERQMQEPTYLTRDPNS